MRVAVIVLALVATVRADNGPVFSAKAQAAYKAGESHYNLGDFERAVEQFELAYRYSEHPSMLFNLAQTHRQLMHCEEAIALYEKYLRAGQPKPKIVQSIEMRVAELQDYLRQGRCGRSAPRPPAPARIDVWRILGIRWLRN